MSVFFITGAARGLGFEIAREALARNHEVVAAGRDMQALKAALPGATPVVLDVTSEDQAHEAVTEAVWAHGRIDVLVNNAGYGLFGAIEEVSDTEARDLFDANVFGLLNVTRAALPTMRGQRSGRVINIGSVVGVITGAGPGMYAASKFAVEGITEALRAELEPLGIATTIVEPGALRTGFFGDRSFRQARRVIDDYAGTAGLARAAVADRDGTQPGDPIKAAKAIVDLAEHPNPPTRLPLGSDAVGRVEIKVKTVVAELEQWRAVAVGTDY